MKLLKDTFQVLRQLYNPFLVLVVLIPNIVGFFLNYKLAVGSMILISLIWMLPLTLLYGFFPKKIIYRLILIFYFLVGILEMGHWVIIGGPPRVNSILVIANTNIEETVGFFDLHASNGLFILIPYAILFIVAYLNPPKVNYVKTKTRSLIAISLVFCIFMGFVLSSNYKYKYIPRMASVSYIFTSQISKYRKSLEKNTLKKVDAESSSDQQQVFVLILGESNSRNHMSLYNAALKTTPHLEAREDIIAYDDVISAYSLTRESIPAMLSTSNVENGIDFYESIDLLDVFHSAGFKTYWLSNQSPVGIFDNTIAQYAQKCDHTEFVDAAGKSTLQIMLNRSYDSNLLKPFAKVLDEKSEKKFIVINLMGTHSAYKNRYTPDFDRFKGNTRREQTIAEYHNAMLYNDFVVDSLLTTLKSKTHLQENTVASAIYLSDHGENLYDELDRVGHSYADEIPKSNVEIPFVVWLSEKYIEMNPDKTNIIATEKYKPFVTDDVFHAVLDMNKILSPLLEENKSVFSKNYNSQRTRILADGMDYDKKERLTVNLEMTKKEKQFTDNIPKVGEGAK